MRVLALTILLSLVTLAGAENVLYVDPHGNDTWSGTKAQATANDGPFATLQHALDAVVKQPGARLVLADGMHQLAAPIQIKPQHSGTRASPLTVVAAEGAHPIISGGRIIRGWQRSAANPAIWRAQIPEAKDGKWAFRQLFIDEKRKTRARTPNSGFFRIQGESSQDKPFRLKFKPGDIKKEWAARGDVEVIALLAWTDIRMQIRAVDAENHIATLSGDPRPSNREANAQYWVENAPEFLDSPGEWYLDPKSGEISYWAEPGEGLSKAEVIAPVLDELVVIQGEPGKPVHDLVFRGIEFSHTDWTLGTNGYADTQAAVAIRGELRAEYAENIRIENCKFSHLAGYAIDLGRGAKKFIVAGNEMVDLGGGGIRIGETKAPSNGNDENNSHVVTDNHLHQLGRVYPPAVGVFILQSGTNRIAHNHIHDLYYTAVSVGWNWSYRETPCHENIVEFNHLHDVGQDRLSDMGAVYTLGPQKGTVIRNNLIHDVSAFTYGGWGLYTDEGSSEIMLENNVVYRCKSAGFHQHYGKENILRNNIFAFNKENQLMRTRPEAHISFIFTNNIVYFDSGNSLGSNWSNDNYKMDHNIYFDRRHAADPENVKFAGGTFEEWKKRGHDLNSIIADPLFIAPNNDDFRLRENSPALKLGFKQIDLSSVGVRPTENRDRN
jgi:parallel beta-helix repeat protein